MSFLDRILEKDNIINEYVKTYNGQAVIVYGAGVGARGIVRFLRENNIDNFFVCVDEGHYIENQTVEGIIVNRFCDVFDKSNLTFDVIIGFGAFRDSFLDKYRNLYPGRIKNIIDCDCFPHFWMEPQIFCVPRKYYESIDKRLEQTYEYLSDELSKETLISFVEQRISGKYSYSDKVVCAKDELYFADDLVGSIENPLLLDCGAYDGEDTIRFLGKYREGKPYSIVIEPDPDNIKIINKNLELFSGNYKVIDAVVCEKNKEVIFSAGGGDGSGITEDGTGNIKVKGLSIDYIYLENQALFKNKTVLIKMDIEGTELKALKGAQELIRKEKPILIVCVYHKKEDIVELPEFIKSINPEYRLYLRRYGKDFRDTVIYAI